jgi:hypothetical protein
MKTRAAGLPRADQFRALGSGYSRFRWYSLAVQDRPQQVVVTLARPNWRRAGLWALVLAVLWSGVVALSWRVDPQSINVAGTMLNGAIVYLAPLYWPLVCWLILRGRLPVLRLDKASGVVHLRGDSRQVPITEVAAVCEVIAYDRDGMDADGATEVYELQLFLGKQSSGFWLLTGSWHPAAQSELSPLAGDIASHLAIPHLKVNAIRGTLEQQGE